MKESDALGSFLEYITFCSINSEGVDCTTACYMKNSYFLYLTKYIISPIKVLPTRSKTIRIAISFSKLPIT